jgi:hypothetical protein
VTDTEGRPLFRPEAVEHHARGRTERRVLDLAERRTAWAFRVVMVAVVAALVAAVTVHADESARGSATVRADGRSVTVLLPVGALRRLRPGLPVRVRVAGHAVEGRVSSVGAPVASGGSAVVPVVADLTGDADAGARGSAVVRLGRRTLAALLLGRHA